MPLRSFKPPWRAASSSTGRRTPLCDCCHRSSSQALKPTKDSTVWTRRSAMSEVTHDPWTDHRSDRGGLAGAEAPCADFSESRGRSSAAAHAQRARRARGTVRHRGSRQEDRRLRRAGTAQPPRGRGAIARGGRRRARTRRRYAAGGRVAAPRAGRRLRKAVRVHAHARVLHADGLLDRAAPVAPREDLHRLPQVPPLPPVRPVRDGRAARPSSSRRRSAQAARIDGRRPPARDRRSLRMIVGVKNAIGGGVTTPQGFRAAGGSAGIQSSGLDLALALFDRPATAAAVFTVNRAQAAPVLVSREHLHRSGGTARAIVVNSGCANACTGDEGVQAARDMASETARLVGCPDDQVLVASTGVIGVALPIERVRVGLPDAMRTLAADQGWAAARAIMTTDPFPKEASTRVTIGGRRDLADIVIGGMAKGSGMIEPMLAPMLAF